MLEADLWNGNSLSHANVFRFGHCVPGTLYICNGVRRKVDRKGTSAVRIS